MSVRFVRQAAFRSGLVFFCMLLLGCANQASVVNLEESSLRVRMTQRGLQRRLEALEKNIHSSSPFLRNQRNFTAELSAQIEELRNEVQDAAGHLSEADHRLSKIEERLESEPFRANKILDRLNQVSAQLEHIQRKIKVGRSSKRKQVNKTSSFPKTVPAPKLKTFLSPDQAYKLAYNDYVSGNYDIAIVAFDAFIEHYSESRLVPKALYWKGESFYAKGDYARAITFFNQIIKDYSKSEEVPKSYLQAGFALFALQKPVDGSRYLQKLLKQFPNSIEAPLAKDKLATFH